MPRMQADTPFNKWSSGQIGRIKPKSREPHKHDPLCISTEPWSKHGLFCWCKCARCWDPGMRRCICSACRCSGMRAVC